MTKRYLTILLILSISFVSCNRKFSGLQIFKKSVEVNEVDFTYLKTKTKIKAELGEKSISFTANIRIKKDSIIWISIVPMMGIEVFRGIITQDSVKYINKLEKKAVLLDYNALSKRLNFDINFNIVQSLLVGNLPRAISDNDKIEKEGSYILIKQNEGKFDIKNYINKKNKKLEKLIVYSGKEQNKLILKYSDFKKKGIALIPTKSELTIDFIVQLKRLQNTVNLEHHKIEFPEKPLNFPFKVPVKYER